jgi:hypothetical protein
MNQAVSIALLVGGIILLVLGFNASQSVSSELSEAFTGSPSDKSVWMLVGGAVAAVAGLIGMMRRSR